MGRQRDSNELAKEVKTLAPMQVLEWGGDTYIAVPCFRNGHSVPAELERVLTDKCMSMCGDGHTIEDWAQYDEKGDRIGYRNQRDLYLVKGESPELIGDWIVDTTLDDDAGLLFQGCYLAYKVVK